MTGAGITVPIVAAQIATVRGSARAASRRASSARPCACGSSIRDRHDPDAERDRGDARRRPEQGDRGRRAPRQRRHRPGQQRQRLRLGGDPRDRRAAARRVPEEQDPLHLVQRRGVGPAGLGGLRRQPAAERAEQDRGDAELRHDRFAELRQLRLRRRPVGLAADRRGRRSRPRRGRSRPRSRRSSWTTSRASGSRTSRRTSTAARTTVRSSPRASRPVACSPAPRCIKTPEQAAIFGGTAGEQFDPLLPPRLRRLLQQLQPGAGPELRRRRARADHAGADEDPGPCRSRPGPDGSAPCGRPRAWPRAAGLRGAGRRRRCSSRAAGPVSCRPGGTLPRMASRSVLITGCSTGIGRATAARLAAGGWTVYATARRPETLVRPGGGRVPHAGARRHRRGVDARRGRRRRGRRRRAHQQRRLQPVRRARDAADGVRPAPVRDQRLRAAADVPARAAGDARRRRGHDRQRQLDGRAADVPGRRRLPRDQVRRRGAQRRAADGGRPLRDRRHLRRAGADPDRVRVDGRDRRGRGDRR